MAFQKKLGQLGVTQATAIDPVDTSTAELISGIGEVGGQTVLDVQKNRLQKDFEETAEVVSTIEEAKRQGLGFTETGDIERGLDDATPELQSQIDTLNRVAGKKFRSIAQAVKQGALTQQAAALHTEAEVKRLVAQTPGFGREINQLARELTGYDPTGFHLRQILDIPNKSSRLTESEKLREEAIAVHDGLAAIGINIPIDTIHGNLATEKLNQTKINTLDAALSINAISLEQWVNGAQIETGVDIGSALLEVERIKQENNGIVDPQAYKNVITRQAEARKQAIRRKAVEYGGVTSGKLEALLSNVDKMYEPIVKSIDENDLGKLLEKKRDTIAKVNALWGVQTMPVITSLNDSFGPQITGQLIEMMSNIADPKQFELIYNLDPGLKAVIEEGQATQGQVAERVLHNITTIMEGGNLNEGDLDYQRVAEQQMIESPEVEVKQKLLQHFRNKTPVRGVSLITKEVPRAAAIPEEVTYMKETFEQYIGREDQEGLPPTLILRAATELSDTEIQELKVVGNRIVVPRKIGRSGLTYRQTDILKRIQPFLDAANQGWANDFGVNPETLPQELISRIQLAAEGIEEPEEEPQPSTRRGRRDKQRGEQ